MSNSNELTNDGLDNLPESQRKETQEILDDITKAEESKPKPEDVDTSKKPEGEEKKDDEGDKKPELDKDGKPIKTEDESESSKRRPWQKAIEHKRKEHAAGLEQQVQDLTAKIAELTQRAKPDDGKPATTEQKNVLGDKVKKLVEESKIDVPPEFIESIIQLAREGKELPEEITEKLAEVDKIKSAIEVEKEETFFSKDFDKLILPLVKAEYGDGIPEEKIAEIKEKLKQFAYSDQYGHLPYEEIYAAKKDFRGVVAPKKRSAEGPRNGSVTFDESKKDYKNLTEAEALSLTPEEFDKWSDAQAANERNRG